MEAARRQLDAAIGLLLDGEDSFAVHTLAAAAFRILRDLAEHRGSQIHQGFKLYIKPSMERKFWKEFNRPANFLKHADTDPEGEYLNFKEEANDGILALGALYYQSLGNALTPEMETMLAFFAIAHPEFLTATALPGYREVATKVHESFGQNSRADQLAFAKRMLNR